MIFAILGSLGGIVAFLGGVTLLLRGIVRNVDATKDNTTALNKLAGELDKIKIIQNSHGAEIQSLRDWRQELRSP